MDLEKKNRRKKPLLFLRMRKNSGRAEHSLPAIKPQTPQHQNTEGVIYIRGGMETNNKKIQTGHGFRPT